MSPELAALRTDKAGPAGRVTGFVGSLGERHLARRGSGRCFAVGSLRVRHRDRPPKQVAQPRVHRPAYRALARAATDRGLSLSASSRPPCVSGCGGMRLSPPDLPTDRGVSHDLVNSQGLAPATHQVCNAAMVDVRWTSRSQTRLAPSSLSKERRAA